MNIFVKVTFDGGAAWWNEEKNGESYLFDGNDLEATNGFTDYLRGTPFNTVKAAKAAGRMARDLAIWDGNSDVRVSYWRFVNGRLVETKFTADNKIKK